MSIYIARGVGLNWKRLKIKIASNLTQVITVAISLFAGGGIPKGYDFVKYDLLKKPHNEQEAFTRHLMNEHVLNDEVCKTATLDARDGFAAISIRPDDCIVIKRKDSYGNVIDMKLLPPPDRADKIKAMYSDNCGIAYASEIPFDFGVHQGGFDYVQSKKDTKNGVSILRVYKDGCTLRYRIDTYGYVKDWQWISYKH